MAFSSSFPFDEVVDWFQLLARRVFKSSLVISSLKLFNIVRSTGGHSFASVSYTSCATIISYEDYADKTT
jgi:hypothetical protein